MAMAQQTAAMAYQEQPVAAMVEPAAPALLAPLVAVAGQATRAGVTVQLPMAMAAVAAEVAVPTSAVKAAPDRPVAKVS